MTKLETLAHGVLFPSIGRPVLPRWLAPRVDAGLGGVVLLFLWFGTAHQAAWRNENLFLLNPLCLALIPAAATLFRARPRVARFGATLAWLVAALAAFALFSKILPWFAQANLDWILLLLPIHAAIALMLANTRTRVPAP